MTADTRFLPFRKRFQSEVDRLNDPVHLSELFTEHHHDAYRLAAIIRQVIGSSLNSIIAGAAIVDAWPWTFSGPVERRYMHRALVPGEVLERGTMVLACEAADVANRYDVTVLTADPHGDISGAIDRFGTIIDLRQVMSP